MKFILNFSIIILLIFAFLNAEHFYPWTTYESEKYIFYASALIFIYFISNNKKNIKIDTCIILLILLSFCSLFLYQSYVFKQYYYIFNIYMINLIILSIVLENYFVESNKLLDAVMVALIISGVLSSVFSIYQWLDFAKGNLWLYEVTSTRFSANLAQPNHLATLLLLSLGSSLYFINKYKLKLIICFIPLLIFSMVLTQSRTVWLALPCMLIMVFIKWKVVNNKIKYIILSLIPMYVVFGYFISQSDAVNVADRATSGFLRLLMWEDFFQVLPHLSFLGIGWRNIEYYQFFYGNKSSEYVAFYHNIFFDLIVLFGFLGFVFFVYIFLKLLLVFKKIDNTVDFLIFSILFVLINHSLLEYPLFYNYFLLIFIVLFFYLDSKYHLDKYNIFIGRSFFAVVAVITITLTFMYTQYFEKNRYYYRAVFMGKCIVDFEKNIIFDEFNNLSLINCKENISYKNLPKFERALLQRPSPNNILKLVYVYHQVGEYHKRDELLKRYNVKYFPKYALSEVLEIHFF